MPDSKYVMQVCISFLSEWTNFWKFSRGFEIWLENITLCSVLIALYPLLCGFLCSPSSDYTTVRFHFGPGHSCWKGAVFLIRLPVLTVAFTAMWTASQTRTVAISGGFLLLLSLNLWPRLNCGSLALELQNILRELRLDIVLVARVSIMFGIGFGQ